ncbi:MAG: potassium/proton antiporter [Sphingomonadales bacterium]
MEFGNYLILISAALILLSIFAGLVSARIGAPLLLVFLGLGMLAGEEGPGGIQFADYEAAYVIGAISLAIVLFDGGLRTGIDTLRAASWPALSLATLGVVITALLVGIFAHWLFGVSWLEGLLIGAIISSTDAAAVFFLLNLHGTQLAKRPNTVLEAESGLNDPMAVFLTVTCVELLLSGATSIGWDAAGDFIRGFSLQILGGAAIGLLGGYGLVVAINRLSLAAGLYPIMTLAGALLVFSGAQTLGASGFLAVYLCGLVVGNRRHRARQLIERFQDGLAWLSQIVMFVMLGLLVTPSNLLSNLLPGIMIALLLIVLARPAAVLLTLAPFRFAWRERVFIAWVGLRGAVPIFLGTIPVMAGLPNAQRYFDVAFLVVLTSLLIQGWSINRAARWLRLALPAPATPPLRYDIDLPKDVGRDMAVFAVEDGSAAARLRADDLKQRQGVEVVAVMRDGQPRHPRHAGRLAPGDQVVILAPEESLRDFDTLFGAAPPGDRKGRVAALLGEFSFSADVRMRELAQAYDFIVPTGAGEATVGQYLARHLRGAPEAGDRLRLGPVELIVQKVEAGRIQSVGIELDPAGTSPLSDDNLRIWTQHWRQRLNRPFRRRQP